MVRTLACHARGQGFESPSGRHSVSQERGYDASVAQLVEQGTENPRVVGSIPTGGTIENADLAHLVERRLAKAKVAGSSPVIRSIKNKGHHMVSFIFYCADHEGDDPRQAELGKGQVFVLAHEVEAQADKKILVFDVNGIKSLEPPMFALMK